MEHQLEDPPRKPGTFKKGFDSRRSLPEQRRGAHIKIVQKLKNGIMAAAKAHGSDGHGAGGVDGYLLFLAGRHPKVYATLLGRLLPHHFDLKTDVAMSGRRIVNNINIIGVPSGTRLPREEVERVRMEEMFNSAGVPLSEMPQLENWRVEQTDDNPELEPEPVPPGA